MSNLFTITAQTTTRLVRIILKFNLRSLLFKSSIGKPCLSKQKTNLDCVSFIVYFDTSNLTLRSA